MKYRIQCVLLTENVVTHINELVSLIPIVNNEQLLEVFVSMSYCISIDCVCLNESMIVHAAEN